MELTHKLEKVNGFQLHYAIAGQGPAIVLLHGWPQTWFAWRHIFLSLTPHFTVVAPDLRGLGDSEKPQAGYDNNTVASDIHQSVQRLQIMPRCIAGHHIGAAVAYSYAANYPDALQRLVVLDGSIPGLTSEEVFRFTPNQPTWQFNFHAVPELPEQLMERRESLYLSWFFNHTAHRPNAIPEPDRQQYVQRYAQPGAMSSSLAHYRSFFESAAQNRKHRDTKLGMPVLALGGEYSSSVSMLETMRSAAVHVEGGVVPDCGHYIPEERPDYLSEQLITSLK